MLMPLLGVGLQVSVQFGIVETLKKNLKKKYGNADGTLDASYTFLCGAAAGVFSGIIVVLYLPIAGPFRSRKIQSFLKQRTCDWVDWNGNQHLQAIWYRKSLFGHERFYIALVGWTRYVFWSL
jgi:hypothetical protein